MYGTLEASGGRGEENVADEESTRARLQYLSAPESGGRQPRIHHDVNDPSASWPPVQKHGSWDGAPEVCAATADTQ